MSARRIFLRSTELGEGTEDTLAVQELLRILADARLITTEEKTVAIAHEALIHE